jgi:polysaccharide pyruvyl transferase WcaK-like protein
LHGCIIGLASGCRVIAMSGDRKVEAFMRAAGLSEWVCEMGDVDHLNQLMHRAEDQPSRHDFVERGRVENREIGRRVSSMLLQLSGDGSP